MNILSTLNAPQRHQVTSQTSSSERGVDLSCATSGAPSTASATMQRVRQMLSQMGSEPVAR